jgi:hypothetical protein
LLQSDGKKVTKKREKREKKERANAAALRFCRRIVIFSGTAYIFTRAG